jgi:methionyl aminopeptidase
MINMGTHRVRHLKDGWSIITADKQRSAHFEHDVALVEGRPVMLSTFDYIYDALGLPKEDPLFT